MASLLAVLKAVGHTDFLHQDIEIKGFSNNSRRLCLGEVFVAYPGHVVDGRDFLEHAIANGAVACLVEQEGFDLASSYAVPVIPIEDLQGKLGLLLKVFYGDPSDKLSLIGVTGTNGKSSCVLFVAQALRALGCGIGVLGTIGNGVWPDLRGADLTTPDAIGLHEWMNNFAVNGIQHVAMEVSSHALVQRRVDQLSFDVAVFTSLSHEHLDYHGSMEAYAQAKFQLFQVPSLRVGVVNLDDPYGRQLLEQRPGLRWIGYTMESRGGCSDIVKADEIVPSLHGFQLTVSTPWGRWPMALPLLGRFNIANMLAAVAVLGALGFELDQLQAAVDQLTPVEGRMQTLFRIEAPAVVVDYAHTPDALEKVLLALREHMLGKIWCVFGCGGDRDKTKRPIMGSIAERYADTVVVTSDNCRGESIEQIMNDIRAGFDAADDIVEIVDRREAITFAVQSAGRDDIVLLAGKGHEKTLFAGKSGEQLLSDFDLAELVLG